VTRASKAPLHFGSSGAGGNTHLAGELFKLRTGANIEHVPYRGTGPAVAALLAGEMQIMFSTMPPALPQVRAGKLRPLGVTSLKRAQVAPEVPTIAEAGVAGYESVGYWGVVVPGKTPAATIALLQSAIVKVLKSDDARAQLGREGIEAAGSGSAEYGAFLKAEQRKWAQLIKEVNLKLE
jgi:tripartite-type tricarboxylate transporter receptor subunit TctC